jgi:hypothetical protein
MSSERQGAVALRSKAVSTAASKRDPSTALRARTNRGKGKGARNSAPFLRQGERDDDAAKYEADREQVAKHLCRAQHAVPLQLLKHTSEAQLSFSR